MGVVLLSLALTVTGSAVTGSVPQEPDLQGTRDAYSAWLETELLISEETRDWRLRLDEQSESIRLVEREIERLAKTTEESRAGITEAEERAAKLEAERADQQAGFGVLTERVEAFESRVRELLPELPASLRAGDAFALLEGRLPEAGEETGLELSQRYLTVVGMLNEIDKFARDLHVVPERHTLGDGRQVSADTLYLGLSLAYYVTADGEFAGRGTPGADGWTWVPANDAAPEIAAALDILSGDSPAAFVSLPLDLR